MDYIITEVHIKCFRKLTNLEFRLGGKINVISGHNGVGKSSLLSLIASASGTRDKRNDRRSFQPTFEEYFEIDNDENYSTYQLSIGYRNAVIDYPFFKRVGFKDDSKAGRGIRLLPRTAVRPGSNIKVTDANTELKKKLNISDSARVPVPTIYLSLARLYPPGESSVKTSQVNKNANIYQKKYYEKYKEWYNAVLPNSISSETDDISIMKKERTGNTTLYMSLVDSNAKTQSVGQDNLGNIISALVDFYSLSLSDHYSGGFLFIDEIEAALHPSALIKLFTLLDKLASELQLQIFLTSHSLTVLKEIINKQTMNPDLYQLVYLKGIRDPNVTKYIDYETLKSDLFNEVQSIQPKIIIYCEDELTEKLFELIVKVAVQKDLIKLPEHKIFSLSLGKDQLVKLPSFDPYFNSVLIILDGDAKSKSPIKIEEWVQNNEIEKSLTPKKLGHNIISLPGFMSPEGFLYKIIYMYCKDYIKHQNFWRSLDSDPDLSNYTSDRVEEMFIIDDETVNLDKLRPQSKDMMKFCSKSRILEDYFSDDEHVEELIQCTDKLKKAINNISKSIKSRRL
ncbi:AAA family ATPase [Listeria goaensis]|uniref:AAA family ATPase n=1 Tax=Listeria goaensis TaxID=1649188 RepID=UPI000B58B350|nr:AAA family ATPase [Listeria goaensis]